MTILWRKLVIIRYGSYILFTATAVRYAVGLRRRTMADKGRERDVED
jgi:hypothetical protein